MGDTSGPNWIFEIPIPFVWRAFMAGHCWATLMWDSSSPRTFSPLTCPQTNKETHPACTYISLLLIPSCTLTNTHISPWRVVARQQETAPPPHIPPSFLPQLIPFLFMTSFLSKAAIKSGMKRKSTKVSMKRSTPPLVRLLYVHVNSWKYVLNLLLWFDAYTVGSCHAAYKFMFLTVFDVEKGDTLIFTFLSLCGSQPVYNHVTEVSSHSLATSAPKYHICHCILVRLNGHFNHRYQHEPY